MRLGDWSSLKFWSCGEWQVIQERLDEMDRKGVRYNPKKGEIFRPLKLTQKREVRVVIIGQDPYPSSEFACGLAFSVRDGVEQYPGSLVNILKEYCDDLGYPTPSSGNLVKWAERGALLINAYPTCESGKPGSHRWGEWEYLTHEIVGEIDHVGNSVFVLLGGFARAFNSVILNSPVLETSHPSPLAAHKGFLGSKIFSKVNDELVNLGEEPFNWRLDDETNLHSVDTLRAFNVPVRGSSDRTHSHQLQ